MIVYFFLLLDENCYHYKLDFYHHNCIYKDMMLRLYA